MKRAWLPFRKNGESHAHPRDTRISRLPSSQPEETVGWRSGLSRWIDTPVDPRGFGAFESHPRDACMWRRLPRRAEGEARDGWRLWLPRHEGAGIAQGQSAPRLHSHLPCAGGRQPSGRRIVPRAGPSRGLRGQAAAPSVVRSYSAAGKQWGLYAKIPICGRQHDLVTRTATIEAIPVMADAAKIGSQGFHQSAI